jgi:hypothetical protein
MEMLRTLQSSFLSLGTVSSTSGAVFLKTSSTPGTATFTSGSLNSDTSVTVQAYAPTVTALTLGGSGAKVFESPTGTDSFASAFSNANLTTSSTSSSVRIGKTSNNVDVTVAGQLQALGNIHVYGKNISATAGITSSNAGGAVLLKATADISLTGGVSATRRVIQTNAGPITLWSDSDNSGAGAINLANFSTLNSAGGSVLSATAGGQITLAGGSDANADGLPDGYATGNSTGNTNGVILGTIAYVANSINVHSGTSGITVRGQSAFGRGTYITPGSTIVAGDAIWLEGSSSGGTSNYFHGLAISDAPSASTSGSIISAKTTGAAITLIGNTTNSGTVNPAYGIMLNPNGGASFIAMLRATGGGDINITGSAVVAGIPGIYLASSDILAANGNINIDGGTGGVNLNSNTNIGYKTGGAITANTGAINVTGDTFTSVSTAFVKTSGVVTLRPTTNTKVINLSASGTDNASTLDLTSTELAIFTQAQFDLEQQVDQTAETLLSRTP